MYQPHFLLRLVALLVKLQRNLWIFIKPYYSAENRKAENVFVRKEIDSMLRENTLKVIKMR